MNAEDGGSPPRRPQAVARMSARQRSKRKAKAPQPPGAEIIEISSDEDESSVKNPLAANATEENVTELEENKRLKALFSAIEDHVKCAICASRMWNPYKLGCGHTFCAECLKQWFYTAYRRHIDTHRAYDLGKIIPMHHRRALARADVPSVQKREIERDIIMEVSATPHPKYSCPTCRLLVRTKPVKDFSMEGIVQTIAGTQDEPSRRGSEDPFTGFFPPSCLPTVNLLRTSP